jgi:protein-S-isoprenylcysteine O-methyltransferase Ste14
MPEAAKGKKIDLERVVLVPVFLVAVVAVVTTLPQTVGSAPTTFGHVLFVAYRALLVVFYALMIVLLMARPEPTARCTKALPRIAAYAGLFLTVLIPATGTSTSGIVLSTIGVVLMVGGLGFSVYALGVLGRSFAIAPQVRTLVRRGPYRSIRHPLYTGEIVTIAGVLCCSPSITSGLVFLLWVVFRSIGRSKRRSCSSATSSSTQSTSGTKRFIAKVI